MSLGLSLLRNWVPVGVCGLPPSESDWLLLFCAFFMLWDTSPSWVICGSHTLVFNAMRLHGNSPLLGLLRFCSNTLITTGGSRRNAICSVSDKAADTRELPEEKDLAAASE